MNESFIRMRLLYGERAMEKLADAYVAVFGIGGVGGYVVEALARSGVGHLALIDHDRVALSNLNRQIIASHSTVGRLKAEVAAERIADINPACKVEICPVFFLPETRQQFDFGAYDYVADAIDTVAGKLSIIEAAREAGTPVISAMGAGNKVHPEMFEVADLYETSICPLAKVMRRECKKRGIDSLKVVYSKETPLRPDKEGISEEESHRRSTPGSTAFAPSVAGLIMAAEIINDLTAEKS